MGLFKTTASKLETLGGDLSTHPFRMIKNLLAHHAERRGLRLAEDLKTVFEHIAADREIAGINESDSKLFEGQYLTLGTRNLTLSRNQPFGMQGDIEWITVGQSGVEVGAESNLEKDVSLTPYEASKQRHRSLARACLRAIRATTVY